MHNNAYKGKKKTLLCAQYQYQMCGEREKGKGGWQRTSKSIGTVGVCGGGGGGGGSSGKEQGFPSGEGDTRKFIGVRGMTWKTWQAIFHNCINVLVYVLINCN